MSSDMTASQPKISDSPLLKWVRGKFRRKINPAGVVETRLTREGWNFLFILAFILVGAILRDVNLLIMLAGLMVGMLVLQWRWCGRSLAGLTLQRSIPSQVEVGTPFAVELQITNTRRLLPTWLMAVEEEIQHIEPAQDISGIKFTLAVPRVLPRRTLLRQYDCRYQARGKYMFKPSKATTRFPFNLMRSTVRMGGPNQVTVHPKQGILGARWLELTHPERQGVARNAIRAGASEGEFYGLRAWQHGDARRWIHWRTTARIGELAVRQFEQQQNLQVAILLDLHGQSTKISGDLSQSDPTETAISFAATFSRKLLQLGNHRLSVAVAGEKLYVAPRVQGTSMLLGLLDELAVAKCSVKPNLIEAIEQLLPVLFSTPILIVISTRPSLVSSLAHRKPGSGIERILQRTSVRWIDVSAGELTPYFQGGEQ